MANRQEELVYAMEELTGTMKRQSSMTETMGQAIQGAMTSTENLKAAMLKNGRFSEGKMLGAIEKMSDMPGRIDKVIQGFGQYLQQGLGSHTDKFIGVVSKISALGLDNGPFLQLARSMNAKMGMSIDQRDQHFKELLNLREVTGQNPELMAKALAQQEQTFSEAAGLWGPGFSEKLMNTMKVFAQGNGGEQMVGQMMSLFKPYLQPGPEGMAKRAALTQGQGPGLSENMSQADMMSFFKLAMDQAAGDNPMFGSAINRQITGGGVLGIGGAEFNTANIMSQRLAGQSTSDFMDILAQIKVGGGDGTVGAGAGNSQSENQLMSVKLNNVINQFADVLPEAITKVGNALDGLAGSAAGLAGWLASMLKGFVNDGADLVAGGIGAAKKLGGKAGGAASNMDLGGIGEGLMGGGKGILKMLINGLMMLVGAFTEGGAAGAIVEVLKGVWGWLANALPRHLRNFWAEGKAKMEQMLGFLGTIMKGVGDVLNAFMATLTVMVPAWVNLLAISIGSAIPGSMITDAEVESVKESTATLTKAHKNLMEDKVIRAFGGDEFERRNFKGSPTMHMPESTYVAEEAGEAELASNLMLSEALTDIKDAFTQGEQVQRLNEIKAGFDDLKTGFNEVKESVLQNLPHLAN